ncbi:MAG TPA: dethiobiotin synthase [Thermodesulfovibrionales bacterium]|nr:dethiobiotin synthase [Thermodesulfovibrionales bacterium]
MARGFFITGTDTGVGKTVVTAALIRAFCVLGMRVAGMKPIETGCRREGDVLYPSDGIVLRKAAEMHEAIDEITPCCFEAPVAPFVASEREGRDVNVNSVIEKFNVLLKKYDAVLVEGAGGILVPIRRDYFMIDLAREMGLPLIVVSSPSLGTINHTLLTVRHALREGITVSGIIVNFSKPPGGTMAEETNPDILRKISPVPLIGTLPYLADLGYDALSQTALGAIDTKQLLKELGWSQGTIK